MEKKDFDHSLVLRGRLIRIDRPLVMGILNATPDSFYEASRMDSVEKALKSAEEMAEQGVDIIDIGACSTRPGASIVGEEEEFERLLPIVDAVRKSFPEILVSVDTFRASVASACIDRFGIDIVNDISGGADERMFSLIAESKAAYILMHSKGTPETMCSMTEYGDVTADVLTALAFKLDALRSLGAVNVIVDPGIGFAKTLEQNYRLIADLEVFKALDAPILIGVSRKSMITKLLKVDAADSLAGTIALNAIAMMKGADLIRVHDVREGVEAAKIVAGIKNIDYNGPLRF